MSEEISDAPKVTAPAAEPKKSKTSKAAPKSKISPSKKVEDVDQTPAIESTITSTVETASEAPQPLQDSKDANTASSSASKKAKTTKEKGSSKKKGATEEKKSQPAVSFSLDDPVEAPKIIKAKGSKNIAQGIAHVQASFNNTIVTITDLTGAVIGWSSAGKMNFRGSRKSTAYAAQVVAQDACRQAMGHGLKEVSVRVKGPGSGRESAVRAMNTIGLEVSSIYDVTPVPHNGCRPPKQRRV